MIRAIMCQIAVVQRWYAMYWAATGALPEPAGLPCCKQVKCNQEVSMSMETMEREQGAPLPDEQKRESGLPGGGQGRRDEVGRTGVYPASGPLPEGDAEYRGQMEWGQGLRGAAGYYDSGPSELPLKDEPEFPPPGHQGAEDTPAPLEHAQ
jgi:hypothetical protein